MATQKPKKVFKLNVLRLFTWESQEWTVKEVALILSMVMLFIVIVITLLKLYVLPALSAPALFNKAVRAFGKLVKLKA